MESQSGKISFALLIILFLRLPQLSKFGAPDIVPARELSEPTRINIRERAHPRVVSSPHLGPACRGLSFGGNAVSRSFVFVSTANLAPQVVIARPNSPRHVRSRRGFF